MNTSASFCEHCGAPLQADMRFCETCGQPVEPAAVIAPSPPPASPAAPVQAASAPAPAAATSRRTFLLVGGGLIVMLALGSLGYYYWYGVARPGATPKPPPTPTPPPLADSSLQPSSPPVPPPPPVPPAQTTPPPGNLQYFYYINPKFRYIISFPRNLLVPQGVFPSGAGQRFLASENQAVLTVWGEYQQMGDSLGKLYQDVMREPNRTCTYKVLKGDWFVMSGYLSDGRVFYRKTLSQDKMFKSFEITYDKNQKDLYDRIVAHLAKSFENTRPVY